MAAEESGAYSTKGWCEDSLISWTVSHTHWKEETNLNKQKTWGAQCQTMSAKKELKALKSKRKSNLCLKDHAIGEISLHIKAGIFYYGGSKIAQYFQLQNPHNWHEKQENGTDTHTQKQSFWKLSNSPEGLISSCKTLGKSQYQTIPERLKGRG